MIGRLLEPSTWAGVGLACHAVSLLLASGGKDGSAWGELAGALAAVLLKERKAQ